MDYASTLKKLEALRAIADKIRKSQSVDQKRVDVEEFAVTYGEVEETIRRFLGDSQIVIPNMPNVFTKNHIEAGFLTGSGYFREIGFYQLLKVIGKVRQASGGPSIPNPPPSVTGLVQILGRFRECCQYIQKRPENEREVQDIIWIMLRSQYERVDREEVLPKFGVKSYKPDFGIPDLQTLIEVKFIGDNTTTGKIQEELCADIPPYLQSVAGKFVGIVAFVYDHSHKLLDSRKFVEDLKNADGITEVIVVPGISSPT